MVVIKDYMKLLYLTLMVICVTDTPITDDVIGYANEDKVLDTLDRIKSL